MTTNTSRLVAIVSAIGAVAALRLVPHPPNFSPIAAMALFSGAFLPRRALAFVAPVAALLLSDVVLGFYAGVEWVYASTAAVVLIGWVISSQRSPLRIGTGAVVGSVLFFAVTNFGVWIGSGMYAHNIAGLAACFAAAIPFFQNSLAGDLFYTVLLFGGFALLQRLVPAVKERQPLAA